MRINLDNEQERKLRTTLDLPLIDADRLIRYIDMQIESGIYSEEVIEAYESVKQQIKHGVDHSKLLRIMLLEE